jgi:predicted MFS family arabinose efflux permease
MGYGLSFWPIPVMAAIQSQIAAQTGSPEKVGWFIPAWTLSITVCFMWCGANTDLLGRRWFLVGGNVFCFIGHLVVATAKSANAVIIGMGIPLLSLAREDLLTCI